MRVSSLSLARYICIVCITEVSYARRPPPSARPARAPRREQPARVALELDGGDLGRHVVDGWRGARAAGARVALRASSTAAILVATSSTAGERGEVARAATVRRRRAAASDPTEASGSRRQSTGATAARAAAQQLARRAWDERAAFLVVAVAAPDGAFRERTGARAPPGKSSTAAATEEADDGGAPHVTREERLASRRSRTDRGCSGRPPATRCPDQRAARRRP